MKIAWVIGMYGLLGSAVAAQLRKEGWTLLDIGSRLRWDDPAALHGQFAQAVAKLGEQVGTGGEWSVYWAAGIGTMQSAEGSMAGETAAFAKLLRLLDDAAPLGAGSGAVALASSAGGIYAGSKDAVISEQTAPAPTTAYARAKLQQESQLDAYSRSQPSVAALAARFSTLYGAGQAGNKQQGLLTHISRCIVRSVPVHIYVSLDTIRDYIAAEDAARGMVHALRESAPGRMTMKIIASERPTTISEIIAIFRRVARRAPRIITSAGSATALYSRKVQFRSIARPDTRGHCVVALHVGIAKVLEAERARYVRATASLQA